MPLEAHLKHVENRKSLLKQQLEELFVEAQSIVLEIGCGHGHWLTDYAADHSEEICLGIDIIGDRIERANRKATRARLANVHFLKAEAMELLELLPESVTIKSSFILFPDPWPKKRHWKNRIMNPDFLGLLADRCLAKATLHFRTDHADYFEWTESMTETLERWRVAPDEKWPFERETVFQARAETFQSMILAKA